MLFKLIKLCWHNVEQAGLCFRGAACPFSHGTGLQSADDVAAALMVASAIQDPDIQMAAAMAASLTDYSRYRTWCKFNKFNAVLFSFSLNFSVS